MEAPLAGLNSVVTNASRIGWPGGFISSQRSMFPMMRSASGKRMRQRAYLPLSGAKEEYFWRSIFRRPGGQTSDAFRNTGKHEC